MDRAALDARNNEKRPDDVWTIATKLYNNAELTFETPVLTDLHEDFSEPIELRFEDMPGGAISPEVTKSRFADARALLITVSSAVSLK